MTRTDKLGDVVLALPVFAYLKAQHPDWRLHAMVAPDSVPLVENDPHVDAIWPYTDAALPELADQLAAERFDAAILLFFHRPLASLLRHIKVPRRVGSLSKLASWFLLNRGVWQNRSRGRHHESEYNLLLARKLSGRGGIFPLPEIHLSEGQLEIGRQFRQRELDAGQAAIFVHPGSGGSALNWPPERYAAVANRLAAREDCRVFVTGGGADRERIETVAKDLEPAVQVLAGEYQLRDFLGIVAGGDVFVGPSTGPLHMAAALQLAVVGLYSPVPTQSSGRWGPRCLHGTVLSPDVPCPARLVCFGERCRHWNCMDGIGVDSVLTAAAEVLAQRRASCKPDAEASIPRQKEIP